MAQLNPIESKILTYLLKRKSFSTTSIIAKRSKVSWNTAEAYLQRFSSRGWVQKKQVGRRIYWKVRK